jgi:hypothetical protein
MRLSQAFRVFFRILQDAAFAERVAEAERPAAPLAAPEPTRQANDAVLLLSVLQREGRLVDFLKEPIDAYSDAQIGAAVREVHRGCRQVLDRVFAPVPAMAMPEGSSVRIEQGYDPARVRLTGQVTGAPPYVGVLSHPGWEASRCELPEWTGPETSRVLAPAEVEIK